MTSTVKINGNVEQTAGTLNAKDVEGTTFKQTGGAATLTGTLTAAVDQDAGTLSANAVVGDVDQDGGTMTVATSVSGDVTQKGAATDSFTAASVGGNVTQEAGNLATVTTASIGGNLEQNGGTVVAQGDTLTVTGTTTQNGGTIGDANDAITLTGKLTQNGGTVAADTLAANNGADISGTVTAATSLTAAGKDVEVKSGGTLTAPTITAANLKTAGKIKATTINGTIEQNNGLIEATTDNLTLNGDVHQNAGTIQASHLTLKNGDVIQAGDAAKIKTGELTFDNSKKIDLVSNNNEIDKLSGNLSELDIVDKDDLSLGQLSVGGSLKVKTGGSTKIDGKVTAGSSADIDAGQNVEFSSGGQLATSSAKVKAGANITQAGASVSVSRGYVNDAHLTAAIQAGSIDLTAGGNIGNGTYNYVTVGGGTVKASAGGDASIASAGSENLRISSVSGANVSLYTAGKLITEGPVTSRGNTTVTAKEFGGIAQSSFGSSLTVNNFNNGARPLLAIFETKGGNKTPKINNQPNDTIVFIDGRLAGGDIQIINKLGALEAFPVQTPELKSEQGVFGNPNFLHDELDVANPFAVGAIDFLLQDVPLLTLTSDFPTEVDKQVAANGLNPTTSYWFGQNPQTGEPEKKGEAEKEAKKKEGSSNDAVK